LQDRILMLRAVDKGPCVVVCSTCRVSADEREDSQGRRGGALLAEALRERQTQDPDLSGVAVEEMPCLFACQRHCVVHIRAPGRIGYVLGDFTPMAKARRRYWNMPRFRPPAIMARCPIANGRRA
jgi:predicted metal-binding protein